MYQISLNNELIVDNFAGGGGASCGIEAALNRPVNIAINHDEDAIGMHEVNHPLTRHYCESVWDVDPRKVTKGTPVGLSWFSPDCKHFSKAKGGRPVDKAIRGLAWVAVRWAATVKPRIIMLENVEEFVTWGPLRKIKDEDGNEVLNDDGAVLMEPCPLRRGMTFKSFVRALQKHGYAVEWRELRACDYGAPTIRKRLFMIARSDGKPIIWPNPTHGPKGSGLKPYRTAAECIDWTIETPSIFERARPLAENTMTRIAKGIKRYVLDAKEPFIVNLTHGGRTEPLSEPFRTITGANRGEKALVSPYLTEHANGSSQRVFSAEEPLRTQCAQVKGGHFALVTPHIQRQFGQSIGHDAREPCGTLTTKQKDSLVNAFIVKHFTGVVGTDIRNPLPTTLTSGAQNQLCTSHIMKMRGSSDRDKHGHDIREPLHTISASGNHHAEVRAFLLKYYGTAHSADLKDPMHTVTSRDRYGLVTVKGELYKIVDIGMRMLSPRELYRAQSFPEDYIITRRAGGKKLTKTAQVKMCGNSVPPVMAQALVRANYADDAFLDAKANTQRAAL